MRKILILSVLIPAIFIGCSSKKETLAPGKIFTKADGPTLIPIEDFAKKKDKTYRHKISPDGLKIAWIQKSSDMPMIHFKNIGEDKIRRFRLPGSRLSYFRWAQDSRRMFIYLAHRGKEDVSVFSLDTMNPVKRPVDLIKFEGKSIYDKRAIIQRTLKNDPDHIIVRMNDRDSTCYDLYRARVRHQKQELIAENPGNVRNWITDLDGNLYGRIKRDKDTEKGSVEIYNSDENNWKEIAKLELEDNFRILKLDETRKYCWALSNRNRDKIALVRVNLENGQEEVIFEHPKVDIDSAHISDITLKPIFVEFEPDYPGWHFLDKEVEKQFEPFISEMNSKGFKDFNLFSVDNSEKKFTLTAYSDKKYAYYYFDSITGEIKLLEDCYFNRYSEILSDLKPIEIKSRDGLTLNGYLTLPFGKEPRNLPTVLLVHGGPWSRDWYGFDREVQFLANRGYAVLQINYRGSEGYGRAFMDAGKREFAGKMHDDLIDAVNWAIQKGIADKNRIAISGASYGGYATLVGLTFTPDVFACGIDVFGMSDLTTLFETAPTWWKLYMPTWKKFIGDPNNPDDIEDMKARSPLFKVDKITKPLLIIYGSEDVRVDLSESKRMIEAMEKLGKYVEYKRFADEGHGISREKNKIKYYKLVEDFLDRHLKDDSKI